MKRMAIVKTFIQVTLLRPPIHNDSEDEETSICRDVSKRVQFSKEDMKNLVLQIGNTYHDASEFRKVEK